MSERLNDIGDDLERAARSDLRTHTRRRHRVRDGRRPCSRCSSRVRPSRPAC